MRYLVRDTKNGNDEAFILLMDKFTPLLKKYAYWLKYEDAYYDLQADFIEVIMNIDLNILKCQQDACLVSYFCKAIFTSYAKIARKLKKTPNKAEGYYLDFIESVKSDSGNYYTNQFFLEDIKSHLTFLEFDLIKLIFFQGYTIPEIASIYRKSPQAISQTKNRAFQKLRKVLNN